MYLDPQDQEKAHKKYLLDFAGKVEMMLASKPSLKRQLKQQCQLCEKKYNDYYRWLESQHEAAKKNPYLLDESAGTPPNKGYIFECGGCYWRKPDRKDLPDITAWFYPYTSTIKTSRRPNVEEQFMRSCVLLAIVHDNVLQNSQQEPIYFTPKGANLTSFQFWATHNIWKWLSELMKLYALENRERAAKEIQIMLDAALESIQNLKKPADGSGKADLPNGKPAETGQTSSGEMGDNMPAALETTKPKVSYMCDQVFICYSHKDQRWLDNLQTHLKPYVRNGSMTVWSDKQIAPGSKWLSEIEAALASAKVAVLLVTPDFLASDFIHEKELGPILKKAENGKVGILWIPVRACSYKETSLKDYQAVGNPEKPLANMKTERDEALVKICEEIKKAVNP